MKRDRRATLTIKLHKMKDADLIAWVSHLPLGSWEDLENSRNAALKTALRVALDLPIPTPRADAIKALRDDLATAFSNVAAELARSNERADALETELNRQRTITANLPAIVKQIAASVNSPASGGDAARIAELERQLEAVIAWANQVDAALKDGARIPTQQQDTAPTPAPQAEDGLTADEQQQRARKLKRQNW